MAAFQTDDEDVHRITHSPKNLCGMFWNIFEMSSLDNFVFLSFFSVLLFLLYFMSSFVRMEVCVQLHIYPLLSSTLTCLFHSTQFSWLPLRLSYWFFFSSFYYYSNAKLKHQFGVSVVQREFPIRLGSLAVLNGHDWSKHLYLSNGGFVLDASILVGVEQRSLSLSVCLWPASSPAC